MRLYLEKQSIAAMEDKRRPMQHRHLLEFGRTEGTGHKKTTIPSDGW